MPTESKSSGLCIIKQNTVYGVILIYLRYTVKKLASEGGEGIVGGVHRRCKKQKLRSPTRGYCLEDTVLWLRMMGSNHEINDSTEKWAIVTKFGRRSFNLFLNQNSSLLFTKLQLSLSSPSAASVHYTAKSVIMPTT